MKPDRMKVRPREGCQVFDPRTQIPLPAEGAEVPRSSYWLRRLRDRDVELVEAPRARSSRKE